MFIVDQLVVVEIFNDKRLKELAVVVIRYHRLVFVENVGLTQVSPSPSAYQHRRPRPVGVINLTLVVAQNALYRSFLVVAALAPVRLSDRPGSALGSFSFL